MERRPTYLAHNETMESIMGIFIDVMDRHRLTLGNDEYLQLERDVMDALCGKYVKKDAMANLLGRTVEFGNRKWTVAHIERDCAYLMLNEVLNRVPFGTDNQYENSELLKAAAAFTSSLPADALAQCQDVSVNGVTAKVFAPSKTQLDSEWDWPSTAPTNRICQHDGSNTAWWTSSSIIGSDGAVWIVSGRGYLGYSAPSYLGGFRPAVKVKISAIESHSTPMSNTRTWEAISERLNSVVPEDMFSGIMRDTVAYSNAMEKVDTVRQKTGAGMVESYIAIMVCNNDIDLAAKMLTEHLDAFKEKANVIYAIGMK